MKKKLKDTQSIAQCRVRKNSPLQDPHTWYLFVFLQHDQLEKYNSQNVQWWSNIIKNWEEG